MKKINKKGELTTKKLVTIILLITSFVIILFLLFRLDLGAITDKEICHNSVVLKAKGKGFVGQLDCKTNYVCISGGGKCEGINPTQTIKISFKGEDEIIKQEIMKVIADEMADCWWMFGEGKLNYQGLWKSATEFLPWSNYHCAVCSTVKFDEKIQNEFSEITYKEFYEYLEDAKKSDTETYLKYLYDIYSLPSDNKMGNINLEVDKILLNEKYVIVTGMKKGTYISSYFVKSDEVTDKTECSVFDITTA